MTALGMCVPLMLRLKRTPVCAPARLTSRISVAATWRPPEKHSSRSHAHRTARSMSESTRSMTRTAGVGGILGASCARAAVSAMVSTANGRATRASMGGIMTNSVLAYALV